MNFNTETHFNREVKDIAGLSIGWMIINQYREILEKNDETDVLFGDESNMSIFSMYEMEWKGDLNYDLRFKTQSPKIAKGKIRAIMTENDKFNLKGFVKDVANNLITINELETKALKEIK